MGVVVVVVVLGEALSGRPVVVGIGTTQKSTQFTAKHSTSDEVDIEVAGVVRQTHLLDECADVGVDRVATPRGVRGVVGHGWVAGREAESQRVADGDRESGDDEVKGHGEQHERRRRRTRRLVML